MRVRTPLVWYVDLTQLVRCHLRYYANSAPLPLLQICMKIPRFVHCIIGVLQPHAHPEQTCRKLVVTSPQLPGRQFQADYMRLFYCAQGYAQIIGEMRRDTIVSTQKGQITRDFVLSCYIYTVYGIPIPRPCT